jgi:hypothetical protein
MKNRKQNPNTDYSLAHVLYQKLGTDWYAFTEVNGDCYMSKVDAKEAEAKIAQNSNNERKTPRAA